MNSMFSALKSLERPEPGELDHPGKTTHPGKTSERLDLNSIEPAASATGGEDAQAADRLLAGIFKQFPVADSLVLGWLSPEDQLAAADLLRNLGIRLAARNHGNVVLVDADTRRKSLTRRHRLREQPGLAELLESEQSLAATLIGTTTERLAMLPSGRPRAQRGGLAQIPRRIQELRSGHRFSLVDLGDGRSPVAFEAARHCDAVYWIVRLGQSRRAELASRTAEFRELGLPLAGCAVVAPAHSA